MAGVSAVAAERTHHFSVVAVEIQTMSLVPSAIDDVFLPAVGGKRQVVTRAATGRRGAARPAAVGPRGRGGMDEKAA